MAWPSPERKTVVFGVDEELPAEERYNAEDITHGPVPLNEQAKGKVVDLGTAIKAMFTLTVGSMTNEVGPPEIIDGHVFPPRETGPNAAVLHMSIEHAHNEDGPWSLLHAFPDINQPASGGGVDLSQTVRPSGFKRYARASWWFARPVDPQSTIDDGVEIAWNIIGVATPHEEEPLSNGEMGGFTWEELVAMIEQNNANQQQGA